MILTPGTLLQNGKYKVVRYIAKGGFGITYEALNTTAHNRRVAIKELFVSDFCNREDNGYVTVPTKSKQPLFEKLRSKFIDEANTLFDLNHPGIVRVLDYFEENATAYYVMEYIEGSSLREKIKAGGKLRETTAVDYVRQVAEALRYVHEHNILHLDIKPANIMIKGDEKTVSDTTGATTDKGVVLIDFGVSKQYDEVSGENTSTLMGRSPGYAPAEQMMSKVGTFTPATDIYSLGATLYTLLTGEVPPESTALSSGEKLPPLPAEISATTRQAVAAAMTTNKYDRPQSIADFLAILDGKRGVTPPPPAPRRSKKNLWVALAVVVGLICGVAGYTHFSGRAPAPAARQAANSGNITETVNGVTFKMVYVQGGTFSMGAQNTNSSGTNYDSEAYSDESPVHSVTLGDYYIAETEVTQALWQAVMGNNPSRFMGENRPVENVSWDDAVSFCKELSRLTGRTYVLPTEAQWEYAARGGKNSTGSKYSGSHSISNVARYSGNSDSKTHEVKGKLPNALGIYDMSGNVWEWCSDYWTDNYNASPNTSRRVLRGGGWSYDARRCRVSNRNYGSPSNRGSDSGFRVALSVNR